MVEQVLLEHTHWGGLPWSDRPTATRQYVFIELIMATQPKSLGLIETPA